ncbi:MAG: DEAD/DEAH box helicase [Alicyclobacillus sp.]|nr:DEAD/DEAH box helicase [Alicyclobacillus sp.]
MKRRGESMTLADVLERALLGLDADEAADGAEAAGTRTRAAESMDGVDERSADGEREPNAARPPGEPQDDEAFEVALNEPLRALVAGLRDVSKMPVLDAPRGFRGQLRPYQRTGFSWFAFLRRFGLGACLADDMGLGKTVQFIAYQLHLREQGLAQGPALIVCPTSVVGNWEKELERFAPGLRVHVHYGAGREKDRLAEVCQEADVVITSYTLAHLDQEWLTRVVWDTVCLDEAQNIKNAHTKQAQAVRRLPARHRIALTGTPVENRLTELWSLFSFLNPGYLGSERTFQQRFATPIEKGADPAATRALHQMVRPFLLRRMKTDPQVASDLPEKTESKVYVPLTKEQAALYEGVLQDMLARLAALDGMERRGLVLATLTKLKQVCNHPLAFLKADADPVGLSASRSGRGARGRRLRGRSEKLERLVEMVEEVRAEGERCLVFTQFVETGELLRAALEEALSEPVLFLHGGVGQKERDQMVRTFQDPDGPAGVFLLSLRAGGVGLNLTAASHVFHFDRWWNPAVENQATDRAYRIGQHRHVQVHKFITLGTLEERIDQLIERKIALGERIMGTGEQWITELSTEELRDLFALRRSWVSE